MNLKRGIKVFLPVLALFLLVSGVAKASLVDEDVGYYTSKTTQRIGLGPVFIKNGEFALVTDHRDDCNRHQPIGIEIIDLRELDNPKLFSTIKVGEDITQIQDIEVSQDGRRLYVTVSSSLKIVEIFALKIFDISELSDIKLLEEVKINAAGDIALTPDNQYLYVTGCEEEQCLDKVLLYQIKDKLVFLKSFDTSGYGLKVSPDGRKMALITSPDNATAVADISNPLNFNILGVDDSIYNRRKRFLPSGNPSNLVFSEDSKKLYLAAEHDGLLVYDVSQNGLEKIQQTKSHSLSYFNQTAMITSVDIAGSQLYLSGESSHQREDLSFIKGFDNAVLFHQMGLKVSPDGSFLVYRNFRAKPNALIIKKLSHKPDKENQ